MLIKENFWCYLSCNPSDIIIEMLFTYESLTINWTQMSKRSIAIDYLTEDNIQHIVWESLCKNASETAIKLIYSKIMHEKKSNVEHLTYARNNKLDDIEKSFTEFINDGENKFITFQLEWINWKYLSLNPYALNILQHFQSLFIVHDSSKDPKNKIWYNIMRNKSSNPSLEQIIRYGINVDIPKKEAIFNLLSNNNPLLYEIIMEILTKDWKDEYFKYLSRNSNIKIIGLFNDYLRYRFNIDWEEIMSNENIYEFYAFEKKKLNFTRYQRFVDSIINNDSSKLANIIRREMVLNTDVIQNFRQINGNKNIDYILNIKNKDGIENIRETMFRKFSGFVKDLIADHGFFIKLLKNPFALNILNDNKEKFIVGNKYLLHLLENPLLFCKEKEYHESIKSII